MGKLDFEAMRTIRLITMCQSTTQSERSYCSSEMNLRCEAVNVHVILLWGSTVSSGDITQTLARAVIAFLSFKKSFRHEASTFRCCYKSKTKCMSEMGFSDMLIVSVCFSFCLYFLETNF